MSTRPPFAQALASVVGPAEAREVMNELDPSGIFADVMGATPRRRGLGKKTIALREAILDVLKKYEGTSMSSRQIAYQLVGSPWKAIENTETEKERVGRVIVDMRREGLIPYSRIVDRSRAKHFVSTWEDATEYIDAGAYRQDIWADQPVIPMVACEKQALEGIFSEVCDDYGVSLWTIRGFNSESFDYEWSEEIKDITAAGKKVVIAYFGDWDPSGLCIEEVSLAKLGDGRRKYGFGTKTIEGFGAGFEWHRLGLLEGDFERFGIANVPVKIPKVVDGKRQGDSRANVFLSKFGRRAAELDALPPDELQRRIRAFIETYIDRDLWRRTKRDEEVQREALRVVAGNWDAAVRAARGAA